MGAGIPMMGNDLRGMADPYELLKLLADGTRLRLLLLLREEELSVAELQEILDMGQSRISSHLALLRQGELVRDRKDGKRTYYSFANGLPKRAAALVQAACEAAGEQAEPRRDREVLRRVIEKRRRVAEQYFNEIAGRLGRNYCPGRSWEAIGHFLLQLIPPMDVADLGAGEGILAHLLARRARHVTCVDNSRRMVEVGSELARRHGIENVEYKLGDIEAVPLDNASVDLACLSQALHHAQHPPRALAEAFRILRPGGHLVIIDLNEHSFEKARELYADTWLGFRESYLREQLAAAGFRQVEVSIVAREQVEPHFETILATGVKPFKA